MNKEKIKKLIPEDSPEVMDFFEFIITVFMSQVFPFLENNRNKNILFDSLKDNSAISELANTLGVDKEDVAKAIESLKSYIREIADKNKMSFDKVVDSLISNS